MNTRAINTGVGVYQSWHKRDPGKISSIKWAGYAPTTIYSMGAAVLIAYRSNKWEKGNITHDYEHDHTSRPTLYSSDGEGRGRSVSGLLGTDVVVDLGTMLELVAEDKEGYYNVSLKGKPKLVCTTDRRTLIILHKDGPLFINGGTMEVTPRGIAR